MVSADAPRVPLGPGIVARAASYMPWSSISRHEHPWAFIALVTAGRVHEVCGKERSVRGTGAVRLMPAGVSHANAYREPGARCFITEIQPDADAVLPGSTAALAAATVHPAGSVVAMLAARMHAEYRRGDDLSPLAMDGLLRQLLAAAARARRTAGREALPPRWLLRARDHLHDACPQAPSLEQLAAVAGVHPGHLVRVFQRHFGCSPAGYVARLRIDRARTALAQTADPIADIAVAVGFSDQAHFSRRFKTIVGTTPARYRREAS